MWDTKSEGCVLPCIYRIKNNKPPVSRGFINGGAGQNRTDDLLNAIQALSQLSYSPNTSRKNKQFPPSVKGAEYHSPRTTTPMLRSAAV